MLLSGGHVTEIERLTPTSTRVRMEGPKLVGYEWNVGAHIRVRMSSIVTLRCYSIWDSDPVQGWLDVVVHDRKSPDGPGLQWLRAVKAGDYAVFFRDTSGLKIRPDATWHLFAGEETAAPGFGSLLRAIGPKVPVVGVHQADAVGDHIELPRELTRVTRDGRSAASSNDLVDAVAALDLPDADGGAAYLAGEARTIQMVRTFLVRERGWNRRSIVTKPFWTPGKRGMD
ncbi:SIP domain-containing protein [Tsukamurella spumae]|uniref:Siderophore-interacting protein n=2 Tax=Tsukamurella spumae TaxID=44753 RepID=A0A846WYH3_9ACTN|nr:siderophore-interacting protein [Tsukamurella spumae]